MRESLLAFLLCVGIVSLLFGCKGKDTATPSSGMPAAEATSTPEKTAPAPTPAYQLSDKDEIEIDKASNRPQLYVLTKQESSEKLTEYLLKLHKCDVTLSEKRDDCLARFRNRRQDDGKSSH